MPPCPDDRPWLDLLLALAEVRDLDPTLRLITHGLADLPDVALVRIWLLRPGDRCRSCAMAASCTDRSTCLHLVASAGRPRQPGQDWSKLDEGLVRFPLAVPQLGHIASTATKVTIPDIRGDLSWIVDQRWVIDEGIVGFTGKPLQVRGRTIGVLEVYVRKWMDHDLCELTSLLANHAAISIANAEALAEIEALRRELAEENAQLKAELDASTSNGDLVGDSTALQQVRQRIALAAPTPAVVLITGESGTGKELVARELHRHSTRAQGPLIIANCAAIPEDLFESEFFGHVRGAFTGAAKDRDGRFARANGGTLFLDEIGELPLAMQGKLLRVLQEGTFEAVGDDHPRRSDVRLIAATNRDLAAEVVAGRFREDLYYRLNVIPIHLPPLRERRDDIATIAQALLHRLCRRLGRRPYRLTQGDIHRLRAYDWPGNVRELQNRLERALIMGGGRLDLDLHPTARAVTAGPAAAPTILTEADFQQIQRNSYRAALEHCGGRIFGLNGAAALLGLNPTTLRSRLKTMGLAASTSHGASNSENTP